MKVGPQLTWADRLPILGAYAAGIVGTALSPRLAHWTRWPTRLGVRGRIAYAGFNALMLFAIRQFVLPWIKRTVEVQERARDELRRELGREPTERELFEKLGMTT
jgi:hypothetical protein